MSRVHFQFETTCNEMKRNGMEWNYISIIIWNLVIILVEFTDHFWIVEWQIHYWLQSLQLRQSAATLLRSWMLFRSLTANVDATAAAIHFGYNDTNTLEFPECLRKFYDTINCISIVSNGVSASIFDWYLVAHHFSKCRTATRSLIFTTSYPLELRCNTVYVELICF